MNASVAQSSGELGQRWPSWWQATLLSAMAGGLGWGIRGQYGHESGAMIAGALVGLTLVFLFCPDVPSLSAARAAAWCAVAIGFGGSMTYAQTIGLTHDAAMIGNWPALRWGMLGLALKGGIWIGFSGAFFGMGLSGVRYSARTWLLLMAGLVLLHFVGVWLLNRPFDPAHRILPRIYFSADWRWAADANVKPRREDWGGLLLALIALGGFLRWKRDALALRLMGWAILGGAVGFPLGQTLQSFHAWNPDLFQSGFWATLDPHMNWWNMMETTFGAVMGAALGLGLWLNRRRISVGEPAPVRLPSLIEWLLVAIYVSLRMVEDFWPVPILASVADLSLVMGLIPIAAIAAGQWWPYLLLLPVTMLPIAGKTIRQLCYQEHTVGTAAAWIGYGVLPVALTGAGAIAWVRRARQGAVGVEFARGALLLNAWLYFWLNFAFFHFPWPWAAWTMRTPNAILFAICVVGLSLVTFLRSTRRR